MLQAVIINVRGGRINIAIIILAAGMSSRMGEFKPLLPVGGQSAVLRVIHTAVTAGIQEIIVVSGHLFNRVADMLSNEAPNVRVVFNSRYEDGMFSSVCTGISALPNGIDGFFLIPADCCAVSASTLTSLVNAFEKAGTEASAHPTYKGKRGHPPLIPADYAGRIITYSGECGLKGSLDTLQSFEVEVDDPGILLDMDTPDDYTALLAYLDMPAQDERKTGD